MAPMTQAMSKELCNTLIANILDRGDETKFADGLARLGIVELEDLTSMDPEHIAEFKLVNKDTVNNATILSEAPIGDKHKIKLFLKWIDKKLAEASSPFTYDDWLNLSVDDFNEYRISGIERFATQSVKPDSRSNISNENVNLEYKQKQEIEGFKRSIKRDPTVYPSLREDLQWDSWNRNVLTLAKTHDVSEVFDPQYVAIDNHSKEMFEQKQYFVFSVFVRTLLTDMGKTIVRKNQDTYDAQKVYTDLVKYHKNSTAANITIDNLAKEVQFVKLDSRWTGTTKGFILNWRDKMRLFEELAPKNEHFTDPQKKRMLESCVHNVVELRTVKTQDEHHKAINGVPLTYLQYIELLLSAATICDNQLNLPPQQARRNVNFLDSNYGIDHNLVNLDDPHNYVDYLDSYVCNNYNTDVSYQANMSNTSYISKEVWDKLPLEARMQLLEARKAKNGNKNVGFNKNASNNRTMLSKQPQTSNLTRDANIHNLDNDVDECFYEVGSELDVAYSSDQLAIEDTKASNMQANKSETKQLHPGDIRNVLTTASKPAKKPNMHANESRRTMVIDGVTWYTSNTIVITYSTFSQRVCTRFGSLVDRGANGGIAGDDVMLIETTHRTCDVSGIDNHTMQGLPIATVAGLVKTINGYVIVILHQYAYSGKGSTIHSAAQIEHFNNQVDDRSKKIGGKQCIVMNDNSIVDLSIRNGLAYLDMSKPTKDQYHSLPHVILTSDVDWDPSVLDNEGNNTGINNLDDDVCTLVSNNNTTYNDYIDTIVDYISGNVHTVDIIEPKLDLLQPNFGYAPTDVIKKTLKCTTQWARMVEQYPFRKHFKSRFPALNVVRRNEPVATDTIFSDTPAIDNGCYLAQIFVGTKTIVTDVYPMKFESDFPSVLQDSIRHRGAMSKLVSDYAKVETSAKVKDILRHYCIQDWQSEPYHQHQNPAERRYQTIKKYTNMILDRTGAPPETWLLVLKYVCYVLNLTYVDKLGTVPLEKLTGQTQDVSILLPFSFWEPVYFATSNAIAYNASVSFPSQTAEGKGRLVGFGESVGDALTFLVLTDDTKKLLYCSSVRSANTTPPNLRLETLEGEPVATQANNSNNMCNNDSSISNPSSNSSSNSSSSVNNLEDSLYTDLVTMFNDTDDNCTTIDEQLVLLKDYNKVIDNLETVHDSNVDAEDKLWRFKDILDHEGPLYAYSPNYKGSLYNVLIRWEDESESFEPLNVIAQDNPIACAYYAKDNNLLNTKGWRQFRNLLSTDYKISKTIVVNKKSYNPHSIKFKFGVQVPRSTKEAYELDIKLNQTKWANAIDTELNQIHSYKTFKNLGKDNKPPEGYKQIRVRFVFDIKHDGRHKARLVAGGHLTDEPDDSVYSSVVSLRDLRLVIFAGEQSNLDVWAADVGNAYLESYTKEKVYIVAGPEFKDLEGCTLVIDKALYGLRSSGLRWHERFADTLRDLGFTTCKASPDVWMRPQTDHYEYIAVYVDDLAIVAKDPKTIVETLQSKYNYKLKGVGPIDYHLGGNFGRDEDGTMRYGPRKYIDKILDNYTKQFGTYPVERVSPLESNDHPELDDSPELDDNGVKLYQSMIGALQWSISLGRFDILAAVMTMSRFRVSPRQGHLDRLKRIYGYLKKFKTGAIRFRTHMPDFSGLDSTSNDWSNTVYNNNLDGDDIPNDMPVALGHPVITITYVDANLMHCSVTGRASTGILHLVNGTPIDWYSKRQSTVQSATYGSEFVAARIATDQIVDLKLTLGYMGIKVVRSIMFGDNQSVVTSASIPQSKLNKRHVALSYHRVREAIAQKVMEFYHIDGKSNPADMLSKFAGYQQFWPILQGLLFWGGPKEGLYEDKKM